MLSLSSQLRLKNLLIALSKHEQEIEVLRMKLCQQEDFEPYLAYRMVDTINRGEVHPEDVVYFFL